MRALRRIGVGAAILLGLALGAAWVLPPLLDWGRQRAAMEALASAALGRKVRIEGAIGLTLLPEPMLTARGVRVLGGGDAEQLDIGSLRLGVWLGSLLRGRVVARELVLAGAEWRLPWPPENDGPGLPGWQVGFSGRVENGRINIGPWQIRDIQLNLRGAEDGALRLDGQLVLPGPAMGGADGRSWQLAARIGEPDPAGRNRVEASLSGRDQLNGAMLALVGTLGGKAGVDGRLSLRGPDLSRLLPAPPVAYRAEGRLRGGASGLVWDEVELELAGVPARASVDLSHATPPVLRLAVEAGRWDMEPWLAPLWQARSGGMRVDLRLRAEAAGLAGGILRGLSLDLMAGDGEVRLTNGAAILPGEAELRGSGVARVEGEAPAFAGEIDARVADPRAMLRWLQEALGVPMPAWQAGTVRRLEGSARLAWAPGRFALSQIAGQVDASKVGGEVSYQAGEPPMLRVSLEADRFALDGWMPDAVPSPEALLAGMGGVGADIQLQVASLGLAGRIIEDARLDMLAEPRRLVLRQAHGTLRGEGELAMRLAAAGQLLPGRQIADARLDVTASVARAALPFVPEAWRSRAELWNGPLALHAEAAGSLDALAVQAQLQLDEGRAETQSVLDLAERRAEGRLVLRHPGAARLLTELGWPRIAGEPGEPVWPGEGSLFLSARFKADKDGMAVEGADITAGALRARLAGTLRRAEDGMAAVSAEIDAERLPLAWPWERLDAPIPVELLRHWRGRVKLRADRLLLDETPLAEGVSCEIEQAAGVARFSACAARWQGGGLALQAVLDGADEPPRFTMQAEAKGLRWAGLPAAWSRPAEEPANMAAPFEAMPGLEVQAGQLEFTARLDARGHALAAMRASLTGELDLRAREVTVQGFDLAAARAALARGREGPADRLAQNLARALREALGSGRSTFDQAELTGEIRGDVLVLRQVEARGAAGRVTGAGSLAWVDETLDLRLDLHPQAEAGRAWPVLALSLNGPVMAPRRVGDIGAALRWLAAPAASPP